MGIVLETGIASASAASEPLAIEAALAQMDVDSNAGISPSPDGAWLAFDIADPRKSFAVEFPSQLYSSTGYSLWDGAAIFQTQLLNLATGKVISLNSERGTSWGGSWSPDGKSYAFYSDRSGLATVWIWDRASGQTRQVSPIVARMFRNTDRPLWTADGGRILFKGMPEGMTLEDINNLNPAYRAKVARSAGVGKSPADGAATVTVYRHSSKQQDAGPGSVKSDQGFWEMIDYWGLADFVLVDVVSGEATRLARRTHATEYAFSPDGRFLAAYNVKAPLPNIQKALHSLDVYPLSGGTPVSTDVVPDDGASFSWSADSTRIAYVTYEGDAYDRYRGYVFSVHSAAKRDISSAIPHLGGLRGTVPLWSEDGERLYLRDSGRKGAKDAAKLWEVSADGSRAREIGKIPGRSIQDIVRVPQRNSFWSPDGSTMVVRTIADDSQKQGFYAVDTRSGQPKRIAELDVSIGRPLTAVTGDRTSFVYFQEDAAHPTEVWTLSVSTGRARQRSNLHPAYANASLGSPRLIEWISLRGEKLKGALLLPARYEKEHRYPLVTWVYGGKMGSNSLNAFALGLSPMFNPQILASRGYAVLYPDIPLHLGTPVQDLVSAVIPAVNRAIELGIADGERLAVMGQSFGGYNTLSLICQTSRFKAAIATGSSSANLFEGYSRFDNGVAWKTGYYEHGQGGMGGTPWQYSQRYFENSPFFYFDRITTPLLIMYGTEDKIASGSGAVFASLQRLGKEVTLLEYAGEEHELLQPGNVVDFWRRRLDFLAEHLAVKQQSDL